jgi:predicted dehydrogenase
LDFLRALSASTATLGKHTMAIIERVGIIGAGRTSSAHARALHRLQNVSLTGVLDADPRRAKALAARFRIPRHFSHPDQFYDEAKPQIVHVLTPPHTHEAMAMGALHRGAHVLVEKPPSLTYAGCDALQRTAEAARLTIGLNENFALDPRVVAARKDILRGSLGKLVHIDSFFGFDGSSIKEDLSDWPWIIHLPGGILEDLLPHPLTVTRSLCGHDLVASHWEVFRSGSVNLDMADELRLTLSSAEGTSAHIKLSLSAYPPGFTVRIYGTRATLQIDLSNMLVDLTYAGPGAPAIARGLHLTERAFHMLAQTARNAVATGLFRAPRPGDPLHLVRAHYMALQSGSEIPAPISRAKKTVQIARDIWPYS